MKKLTPQQLRAHQEKDVARKSNIEDLLMDAETIKQQIQKKREQWDAAWRKHNHTIKELEVKEYKAKRLIKYKREQIISRKK